MKYLCIGPINVANALGIVPSIENAFKRVKWKDFIDKLVGINVDGASTNIGEQKSVGTLLKEKNSLIQVINCFNHCTLFYLKNAFINTLSEEINLMLHKFYNSYQKHPKRFSELGEFSQAYNQTHYLNPVKIGQKNTLDRPKVLNHGVF